MARPTVSVDTSWASTRSRPASSEWMPCGVEGGAQRGGLRGADLHDRAEPGELGQRGVGDEPAGDQHDDVVDGLGHLGQQMAGDHHGATGGGVAAYELAQPAHPFGVEAVGGLVEHEDLGVAEQGGGEPEPLTHAEREAADASPSNRGQPDVGEHRVDPLVGQAGGGGEDAQVLAGPAPGMEAGRLEHGADVADRFVEGPVGLTVDGR